MPRVRTSKGNEVTPEMVSSLAAEAEAGYDPTTLRPRPLGGRPSLGAGGESPRLQFRVSAELHRKAQARARAENRSLSDVARELLKNYTRRMTIPSAWCKPLLNLVAWSAPPANRPPHQPSRMESTSPSGDAALSPERLPRASSGDGSQ